MMDNALFAWDIYWEPLSYDGRESLSARDAWLKAVVARENVLRSCCPLPLEEEGLASLVRQRSVFCKSLCIFSILSHTVIRYRPGFLSDYPCFLNGAAYSRDKYIGQSYRLYPFARWPPDIRDSCGLRQVQCVMRQMPWQSCSFSVFVRKPRYPEVYRFFFIT